LLFKKLDVRIQGTATRRPWQGGKFEGQLGFVVLTKRAHSIEESTYVKTGYAENRALLQIRHLVPEHSTEVPAFRATNSTSHTSIHLSVGSRVVVIGPDSDKCSDYVGNYALVAPCSYDLLDNCALIQIASPGDHWGKYIYIDIRSLCRSNVPLGGPLDWFGTKIG
jgi:hypothetical protein